jgi:broad specificity phosphatase PhoE
MMAIETSIHTIRHAHTKYNAEKRYAGTIDVSLSDKGIQETRLASSRLMRMGIGFDIIVTSTMKRSIETAHLLFGDGTKFIESKLCDERNFGIMEGHTWDEVQQFKPKILFIAVGDDLHSVNPLGGEHFEDLWERAKKFKRFLFTKYLGKNILVVSHGVFLQMFHGVLKGSSCIESLGTYPSNLELASFYFLGKRLIEMKTNKLTSPDVNITDNF